MGVVRIGTMEVGMCQTNSYFLYREGFREAVLIDPPDRGEEIYEALAEHQLDIKAILLTHGHFDHIWGIEGVQQKLEEREGRRAPVYALAGEKELLANPKLNLSQMAGRPCSLAPDEELEDGQRLRLADMDIEVIATPGHTAGSCCYYVEEKKALITGDTLFAGSVGRTDFPTGDGAQLLRSIREKIWPLPEDTKIFAGHGEESFVGHEKQHNLLCRGYD